MTVSLTKLCLKCGNPFTKPKTNSLKRWRGRKYCSPKCAKHTLYRSGENTGTDHHNWKGGRTKSRGYVVIRNSNHPNATTDGRILEHRLVMSNHLGRKLLNSEVVHHINGIIDDNRVENLEILTRSEHAKLEAKLGNNVNAGHGWGRHFS